MAVAKVLRLLSAALDAQSVLRDRAEKVKL
jgi:hypothetical protein